MRARALQTLPAFLAQKREIKEMNAFRARVRKRGPEPLDAEGSGSHSVPLHIRASL